MTFRHDLERILEVAGSDGDGDVAGSDGDGDVDSLAADGHERLRAYQAALAAVPAGREGEIVAVVLRDPDRVMAESAVLGYVDSRAAGLVSGPSFDTWAATVTGLVDEQSFIARRIREWRLFKRVMAGDEVDAADLGSASNWLQRKVVEEAASVPALAAIGEVGRTKRVRNLAKTRAGRARQG